MVKFKNKKLLVCDLDNTLYDWVGYFIPSFYAMIDEVVKITNCDRNLLLNDFQTVHRQHHDSEHPFALLETETIRQLYPTFTRQETAESLDKAFHVFNMSRKKHLQLYSGVRDALESLSQSGVILVAHTESKLYATLDRLNRLEILDYFQHIYCRERPKTTHPNPEIDSNWLKNFPMHKVVELSHHQRKPNSDLLLEICRNEGILATETAYVGDSVARDILMAKSAGVFAIWAKYGALYQEGAYQKLVRISHWNKEDITREARLKQKAANVKADYILENDFSEIFQALSCSTSIPANGY